MVQKVQVLERPILVDDLGEYSIPFPRCPFDVGLELETEDAKIK